MADRHRTAAGLGGRPLPRRRPDAHRPAGAPTRRGALTALFLAIAYLGFAVPFLMAVIARASSPATPLGIAAVVTAVLALRLLPVAARNQL